MQPNKTLFFVIIGLAIVAVVGMFLGRSLLAESLDLPTAPQEISIQVVVAPSIKPWVDKAAQDFNQANPKTQVQVIAADDLIPPEAQFTSTPQTSPPVAWLAEATFVVEMARNSGLQFDDARSVASTSLAWGVFNNRKEEFIQQYGDLTWVALHERAIEPDSSLKVVIALPRNSAEGLAALISAAAAYHNSQTLSGADARSAEPWLSETLKESARGSLTLSRPAEAFATRGASVGDAGLLTQASWQQVGLQNRPDFSIIPAQFNITLDYPFAIWNGTQATPESQQAAVAFRDFLLSEAQQNALAELSLERAGASVPNSVQADDQAVLTLFRWAERELR